MLSLAEILGRIGPRDTKMYILWDKDLGVSPGDSAQSRGLTHYCCFCPLGLLNHREWLGEACLCSIWGHSHEGPRFRRTVCLADGSLFEANDAFLVVQPGPEKGRPRRQQLSLKRSCLSFSLWPPPLN